MVLPLVCVLVVQLRKTKREERRRQEETRRATEDPASATEAARMADAPPAYEELFGNPESVSVISAASGDSGQASDDQRRGSAERLVSSRSGRAAGHTGPGLVNHGRTSVSSSSSSLSSSSASSSSPILAVVSAEPSTRSAASSRPQGALNVSSLAVHSFHATSASAATTAATSSSNTNVRRVSSGSETSSNASSAAADPQQLSTISDGNVTHYDPPPAYDWPGHRRASHVTVVLPVGASDGPSQPLAHGSPPGGGAITTQPASSDRVRESRFLGMHLSIFDLMAVILSLIHI